MVLQNLSSLKDSKLRSDDLGREGNKIKVRKIKENRIDLSTMWMFVTLSKNQLLLCKAIPTNSNDESNQQLDPLVILNTDFDEI